MKIVVRLVLRVAAHFAPEMFDGTAALASVEAQLSEVTGPNTS